MRLFLVFDVSGSMLEGGSKAFVAQQLIKAALFECSGGRLPTEPENVFVAFCAAQMEIYQLDENWQFPYPSDELQGGCMTSKTMIRFMKEIAPDTDDCVFFFSDQNIDFSRDLPKRKITTVLIGDEEDYGKNAIEPEYFITRLHTDIAEQYAKSRA